ncbi:uncharacterized protein MONOS_7087 [Monocercomonoides exilis]|uniref:uncharacterized protein n=1 Tax=Monocercomonoides exilis TaxID=2049356 RepID=UPI00355A159D|nr:hypothetical protein MONOS_7087 [Monocercomonoides exilis]|eukprot:MONOS_7087.1-p1 / transcript=MONOS_7087.1 / gene=MONOS_7087 / organism=Monocercomonoides_exilis_PA203 / gene_product=unspecified product / transcript_product=unspecified product / location=Mono_scaffold00235:25479-26378(+) / protein_length=187 / sequence_SO=supercontig / SO=protein_coding / is_pseudo=false
MGKRMVAVCEVGEIVEKGLSEVGLRTEDVVLSPAAIALAMLEKREEAEEAKEKKKKKKRRKKRRSGEYGWQAVTDVSAVTIDTSPSLLCAYNGVVPSLISLNLLLGLCENCQEKLTEINKNGSAVILGPDLNGKVAVAKVASGVSVVGEANSGGGGGGGREDATVQQKMNKMEKETKMLIALSKVQ